MFARRNSLPNAKSDIGPVTNLLHILAVGPLAGLLVQSVYCALNCLWRLSECPDEPSSRGHRATVDNVISAADERASI